MKPKKLKFVAGAGVILAAVLTLAMTGIDESRAYYQTVPELKAMGVQAEGRRLRVAGNVVDGSIERLEQGVVTFDIEHEAETLTVRYVGRGPLPDTLVDRAEAVAEGTLSPDGTFEATIVQAKCASKYEVAYDNAEIAAE